MPAKMQERGTAIRFLFFGNLGTETKNTIVCMGKSLYLWRCRKYVYGWNCSE